MDHRLLSLKFIQNMGLTPVKVRPKQKDPFPEWDPRTVDLQDKTLLIEELKDNKDLNIGALFHGKNVDIDLDTDAPHLHAALDYFLPKSSYVWGRKSKPRSHRAYTLQEDFDRNEWSNILRYLKGLVKDVVDDFSYSIEIRGGEKRNGLFSVMPGSVHPSGERVEWDEGVDPTIGSAHISVYTLVKCIRLAVLSAIISQHWTEGRRNDLSLSLAGLLWRVRTSTLAAHNLEPNETPPIDVFVIDDKDAEHIFKCVMAIGGDDPADQRSRLINLANTWRKLDGDAEARVTGGKALAEIIGEGGDKLVKAAYRLLSDNGAAEQIEKLAEQFVIWYGPGVAIDLSMVKTGADNTPWMTKQQAVGSLGGKKIVIGSNKIKIVDLLFSSPVIERVHGFTFEPNTTDILIKENGVIKVNQFRGFEMEPHEEPVTDEEVEPFLEYINKTVANEDEGAAKWVLDWCADILQDPSDKPGTALVLVGVQGAGKSFLGTEILGKMIGDKHYSQMNSVSRLTDKFNTQIDNRLLIQCDEAIHSYQKDVSSRLKSLITDPTYIIEPKGVNTYTKPNKMRLLFTSNEDMSALFIDPSPHERRFTVLKVSSRHCADVTYWSGFVKWLEENRPKVMRWLLDREYDKKAVRRPYSTAAKRAMQRVAIDPEVAWLISRMADGFIISEKTHEHWFYAYHSEHVTEKDKKEDAIIREHWPDLVYSTALEDDFRRYVRAHGRSVYSGSLLTTLRRIMPDGGFEAKRQITIRAHDPKTGQLKTSRIRMLAVPPVDEILAKLTREYGPIIEDVYNDARQLANDGSVETDPTEEERF